jgi:hypothetical protein
MKSRDVALSSSVAVTGVPFTSNLIFITLPVERLWLRLSPLGGGSAIETRRPQPASRNFAIIK